MPKIRSRRYTAIIGDIVGSKKLGRPARARIQRQFETLLTNLNHKYARSLASPFSITLGDEFQGILDSAAPLPDLIWDIESGISAQFRIGLGHGSLYTPVQPQSSKVDGPALHNAREAILQVEKDSLLGGTLVGFGKLNAVLNALSHILWFQRSRWTDQQRKIVNWLRQNESQSEVAKRLGITRQSISQHAAAAGWQPYHQAETAFRGLLSQYVDANRDVGISGGA